MKRYDFRLGLTQLCDITERFVGEFHVGLRREGTAIRCLPSHIAVTAQATVGSAYVLDLGGSNLRASYVDLHQQTVHPPLTQRIAWRRGQPFAKNLYLDVQAALLARLPQMDTAPLGYCFSYPAASEMGGDARLIRWTKGVFVPDTEGHLVGAELLAHLQQKYERRYSGVAVVNDTVTSLLAGLSLPQVDAYAGVIAGTGMNTAALVAGEDIPKLSSKFPRTMRLPVNLESGNFTPPHLTEFDDRLDAQSENPGEQRCESAAAGMYLGRLFALANPDIAFDPESGAQGLVRLIENLGDTDVADAALSIYHRSAQLVATQLAGLAAFYKQQYGAETIRILAEGGLAWSAITGRVSYHQLLTDSLQQILAAMDLQGLHVEIVRVDNANLIGAAVAAALVEQNQESG